VGSVKLAGEDIPNRALSELAGTGSRSAARAIFGGFVLLPANASYARQVYTQDYWPQLRVLVVVVEEKPKEIPSREAMTQTAHSSPYYPTWIRSSRRLLKEALAALERRDIERLGAIGRISYMRMHAAMMAGNPPIRYWKPVSLAVQDVCGELRKRGTGAWETMDAGPQVKILCTAEHTETIRTELLQRLPDLHIIESYPGMGARITDD
jgi:diphosphomevalonate decarboxylase